MRVLREALHHLRARRPEDAAPGEEGRQPQRLRPRQAARQHDARAAQAPGVDRRRGRGGRPGDRAPARARRARGADHPRRRLRHPRARQARQDRVHPLRLGVPQLRDAGRLPRGGAGSEGRQKTAQVSAFGAFDHAMMRRALALAENGLNTTTPNPRVGCVITRDQQIVAEGWHERAGGPHAEAVALERAGPRAAGATVYVSLEPCNHYGRTPPCAGALINARVARVVAALRDPNLPAARGGEALAAARIRFEHGLMEDEARELNIGFLSRVTRGRPWVRLKAAATLDGRTALSNGASQWITGAEARRDGHRWRARACALLTGIGTVKADDPQLTVREVDTPRQPLRVVIDSRLETPPSAKILQGGKVLIFAGRQGPVPQNADVVVLPNANGKVELPRMLEELARRGINELHVEAGFRLNGSLVREGCVDEYLIYLNPSLLGDAAQGMFDLPALEGLDKRPRLKILSLERFGEDLRILARPA